MAPCSTAVIYRRSRKTPGRQIVVHHHESAQAPVGRTVSESESLELLCGLSSLSHPVLSTSSSKLHIDVDIYRHQFKSTLLRLIFVRPFGSTSLGQQKGVVLRSNP